MGTNHESFWKNNSNFESLLQMLDDSKRESFQIDRKEQVSLDLENWIFKLHSCYL